MKKQYLKLLAISSIFILGYSSKANAILKRYNSLPNLHITTSSSPLRKIKSSPSIVTTKPSKHGNKLSSSISSGLQKIGEVVNNSGRKTKSYSDISDITNDLRDIGNKINKKGSFKHPEPQLNSSQKDLPDLSHEID